MSKQTYFSPSWLTDPEFMKWLSKDPKSNQRVLCKACNGAVIQLGNMGKQALKMHAKGKKHQNAMNIGPDDTLFMHFKPKEPSSNLMKCTTDGTATSNAVKITQHEYETSLISEPLLEDTSPESENTNVTLQLVHADNKNNIEQFVTRSDTLKAEILWVLKIVTSRYSCNSSEGTSRLFQQMFPDSTIAKKFSCAPTKCSYLMNFGLAPYFAARLLNQLKDVDYFVISFDESMNSVIKEEQMDLIIRFWDTQKNKVVTRFFTSEFLGHTTAKDLKASFKKGIEPLNGAKMLQISMDGPKANWSFLNLMNADRKELGMPELIEIGSCSLHVLHGAFRYGMEHTEWRLDTLLRALYYLFHDSPARREDFIAITGSSTFALNFSGTRWLEDVQVAERAILIWDDVTKFVKEIQKRPKSKQPSNSSFKNIQLFISDPLMLAKLRFFVHIAKLLVPFLELYQSDKPMLPFVAADLKTVISDLLAKFVKENTLTEATTTVKLLAIDLDKSDNLKLPKAIDIGFSAKLAVQQSTANAQQKLEFYNQCTTGLKFLCKKLLERSPLKYPIVRNLVCLNPSFMVKNRTSSQEKLSQILLRLIECGWLSAEECDKVKTQYQQLIADLVSGYKEECKNFNVSNESLDTFFHQIIGQDKRKSELWKVIKMTLILSHGQAAVERGFSTNKGVLTDNMQKHSLKSQRIIVDGLQYFDCKLEDIKVDKDMLESCRHAHSRYVTHLDENKKHKKIGEIERKRKMLDEELRERKKQKIALEKSVQKLAKDANEKAYQAEKKKSFHLLSQSNAFRSHAQEKEKDISAVNEQINELEKKLKDCA